MDSAQHNNVAMCLFKGALLTPVNRRNGDE